MDNVKNIWLMFILFMLLFPCSIFAEDICEETNAIKLEDITVKGEAIPRSLVPATVNIVTEKEIEDLNIQRTDEILEEVPGIEIRNFNQGGVANALIMRGFRSGAHGGDVAIYVDGIPLNEGESHADGYADMNVIIPLEIERVEVYKGPSSPLFGNFARAGAISFITKKTGIYQKIRTKFGSFDTLDVEGAFGHKFSKSLQTNMAFQFYRTDGYQENSEWIKGNFSSRFSYKFSEKFDASLSLRFHSSEWDAPGYIPEYQFNDRDWSREQAINAEDDGGEKEFYSQRLDFGYNFSQNIRLLYWVYATQQDFTRFAKFGYDPGGQTERNYVRHVYGTGGNINFDTNLASYPIFAVLGLEYYYENTDWKRWNTSNRVRIEQTQDREFVIETFSLFSQLNIEFSRYFRPQIGFRYDIFGGDYDNHDPGTSGFHYDMNDYSAFSPKVGFHSLVLDSLDLRVSYSQGFALPKGEAKYDPSINVDPVKIQQYEIGFTFTPLDQFFLDMAAYILDTTNEIQENPPGSGQFENIGKTRRKGIELEFKYKPLKGLELFGNLSLMDAKIIDNPDLSLEGKKVKSVPKDIFNLGFKYNSPLGLIAIFKWRHVGKYYTDDLNEHTYDGYDVVDSSFIYEITDKKGVSYKFFVNVDNLFDEHYAQSVFYSRGTNNYAVAWPRTFWVGFQASL